MAKQTRNQRMKNLSWLLGLTFVGLAAAGAVQIRHDDVLTWGRAIRLGTSCISLLSHQNR